MNPVVHFEMPAKDKKRVSDFYTNAFGWKMQQMGEEMGSYIVATTTESDEKSGRPKAPGAINGGFFEYKEKAGFQYPSVVISVDDIKVSIEAVKKAGGTVLGGGSPNKKNPEDPDDIPGIGLYVSFVDTEGNRVGMLQPSSQMDSQGK